MDLAWFIGGIIIGGGIVFFLFKRPAAGSGEVPAPEQPGPAAEPRSDEAAVPEADGAAAGEPESLDEHNEARSDEQQERHQKIMQIVRERGEIDNNTIEEEFGVSHATATRDLDELEREGKLVATADAGRHVTYTAAE